MMTCKFNLCFVCKTLFHSMVKGYFIIKCVYLNLNYLIYFGKSGHFSKNFLICKKKKKFT